MLRGCLGVPGTCKEATVATAVCEGEWVGSGNLMGSCIWQGLSGSMALYLSEAEVTGAL